MLIKQWIAYLQEISKVTCIFTLEYSLTPIFKQIFNLKFWRFKNKFKFWQPETLKSISLLMQKKDINRTHAADY